MQVGSIATGGEVEVTVDDAARRVAWQARHGGPSTARRSRCWRTTDPGRCSHPARGDLRPVRDVRAAGHPRRSPDRGPQPRGQPRVDAPRDRVRARRWRRRMTRVVLTNDDGVDSPALVPFARALARRHDVLVCTPDGERSWSGKAVSRHVPITLVADERDGWPVHHTSGTPADAAQLGVHHVARGDVDVVVSGINVGFNHGSAFLLSSGTVGAAIEGWIAGCTAVAFSTGTWGDDWDALGPPRHQPGRRGGMGAPGRAVRRPARRAARQRPDRGRRRDHRQPALRGRRRHAAAGDRPGPHRLPRSVPTAARRPVAPPDRGAARDRRPGRHRRRGGLGARGHDHARAHARQPDPSPTTSDPASNADPTCRRRPWPAPTTAASPAASTPRSRSCGTC